MQMKHLQYCQVKKCDKNVQLRNDFALNKIIVKNV